MHYITQHIFQIFSSDIALRPSSIYLYNNILSSIEKYEYNIYLSLLSKLEHQDIEYTSISEHIEDIDKKALAWIELCCIWNTHFIFNYF